MTYEDYLAAFSRTTSAPGAQWIFGIAAVSLILLGAFLEGLWQAISFGSALWLFIMVIRAPMVMRRSWARHYMRSENYAIFGEAKSTIDETGLLCEYRSGRYEFTPWQVVRNVEDVDGVRLFLTGQNTAIIVRRRAYGDDDWSELTEFVRQRFPNANLSLN